MLEKEKKLFWKFKSLVELCIFALWIFAATIVVQSIIQSNYYNVEDTEVIRVVANSNHKADQQQKEQFVESYITSEKMNAIVGQMSASYSTMPSKFYNHQFYPQQVRATVQITLGAGRGDNWFCVLFYKACGVQNKQDLKKVKKRWWKK